MSTYNHEVLRNKIVEIMKAHPEPLSAPKLHKMLPPELQGMLSPSRMSILLSDMWHARKLIRQPHREDGSSVKFAYAIPANGVPAKKKRRVRRSSRRADVVTAITQPHSSALDAKLAKIFSALLDVAVTEAHVRIMRKLYEIETE
jgi:hypothetical protein